MSWIKTGLESFLITSKSKRMLRRRLHVVFLFSTRGRNIQVNRQWEELFCEKLSLVMHGSVWLYEFILLRTLCY